MNMSDEENDEELESIPSRCKGSKQNGKKIAEKNETQSDDLSIELDEEAKFSYLKGETELRIGGPRFRMNKESENENSREKSPTTNFTNNVFSKD